MGVGLIDVRRSGKKLNIADIRHIVVVRRGLEMACLTWVSTALRPVRPTLSMACASIIQIGTRIIRRTKERDQYCRRAP